MSSSVRRQLLPHEIIFEILSWLPVCSLLRFKCVSRQWSSTIQDLAFVDVHMKRAIGGWVYRSASEDPHDPAAEQIYISRCRGLILEKSKGARKYRLRNPSTREILHLPAPDENVLCCMRLCYITSTNEFKLVYPYTNGADENGGVKILTVGTNATWRIVEFPFSCKLGIVRIDIKVLDEVYYMIRLPKSAGTCDAEIVCLELKNEQISRIKIPDGLFLDWRRVGAVDWEGKMSLGAVEKEKLHVWVLESVREQKWADRKIVIPLTFMKEKPERHDIFPCALHDIGLVINSDHSGELLVVDIVSGNIVQRVGAPEGEQFLYYNEPSLLHLEGMQPETESN
ncbi:F-box protein [Sesamum alatum]|uniref:F-box protein n=1 Tax=Sesamum alatum TaxID=300844 RepID=A0AAE2CYP3_9LAMI|nr:F-box protein [Sesamum alatum]